MSDQVLESIKIVGLPKGSILWPTGVAALILGILGWLNDSNENFYSTIFLVVFTLNLLVLFYDFSRGVVVGIFGMLFGIIALLISFDVSLPLGDTVEEGIAGASGPFLMIFGAVLMIIMITAYWFKRSFDYFIVSSNEIVKKQGILGDAERYNAPNVSTETNIPDVFESLILFGSGNLIINTKSGRSYLIENVPRINAVDKKLTELLGRIEVDTN